MAPKKAEKKGNKRKYKYLDDVPDDESDADIISVDGIESDVTTSTTGENGETIPHYFIFSVNQKGEHKNIRVVGDYDLKNYLVSYLAKYDQYYSHYYHLDIDWGSLEIDKLITHAIDCGYEAMEDGNFGIVEIIEGGKVLEGSEL